MYKNDFFAHDTAIVDDGAIIGAGTKIWHFSHIMADSVIGQHCTLGQNVFAATGCIIGSNCKTQNNVSLYTGVVLEDDVFCGPSMVFTNVITPRSHVVRKDDYQETRVCRGATIGANATVVCGVTLGKYCFIGAGSVVTKSVPNYALIIGNPGRLTGYICYCGVKLDIPAIIDKKRSTICSACGRQYGCRNSALTEVNATL